MKNMEPLWVERIRAALVTCRKYTLASITLEVRDLAMLLTWFDRGGTPRLAPDGDEDPPC